MQSSYRTRPQITSIELGIPSSEIADSVWAAPLSEFPTPRYLSQLQRAPLRRRGRGGPRRAMAFPFRPTFFPVPQWMAPSRVYGAAWAAPSAAPSANASRTAPNSLWKTEMCNQGEACPFYSQASGCRFAHSAEEIRTKPACRQYPNCPFGLSCRSVHPSAGATPTCDPADATPPGKPTTSRDSTSLGVAFPRLSRSSRLRDTTTFRDSFDAGEGAICGGTILSPRSVAENATRNKRCRLSHPDRGGGLRRADAGGGGEGLRPD